jgi:hypothetical protein
LTLVFVASSVLGAVPRATADESAPTADLAVLGPLMSVFQFGTTAGIPLTCNVVSTYATAGIGQSGLGSQAEPLIDFLRELNEACGTFAPQATAQVVAFRSALTALTGLNPTVNQVLEALAQGADQFGTTYGSAIAPFGDTAIEFAATIRWFKGAG